MRRIDALLRGGDSSTSPTAWPTWQVAVIVIVFGVIYGVLMGTYTTSGHKSRMWQSVYSAIKVPLLLLATFGLSLPSFFVLNSLAGLRADFGRVVRSLMAAQAALTVILSSLSPITIFSYLSGIAYQPAIFFNGLMFAIASIGAQMLLRRLYRPLIIQHPRHRIMLRLWLILYAFVGIQMGWVLRPFIGNPLLPTGFFREGAWTNAYEVILRMAWGMVK